MKYVSPEMEMMLALAADVITTSVQGGQGGNSPTETPDDEF